MEVIEVTRDNLQAHVAAWSLNNFGDQVSNYDPSIKMSFNAPLLGIIEEVGELCNASHDDEFEDAIADAIIYSCDFCSRFGIMLPLPSETHEYEDISIILGELCHSVLKTHQGIRGYEDHEFVQRSIRLAMSRLMRYLTDVAKDNGFRDPIDLAVEVFQNTVSKRDWKKNKETGE